MINYILLAAVVMLAIGVVIASEQRCGREIRRARLEGMREGINIMGHTMMKVVRETEINSIDVENITSYYNTQVELEEWAEL